MTQLRRILRGPLAAAVGPAAAIWLLQLVLFPVPLGITVRGITIGLLTAMIAVGAALVHRANRIVNFAQADLGYPPALFAAILVTESGLNYWLGLGLGLVGSFVVGGLVELLFIRRFFKAPRLILTVATIGLGQLLAVLALLTVRSWHKFTPSKRIDAPWDMKVTIEPLTFDANQVLVWVVAPIALFGIWFLLTRTKVGAQVRASAERADRAALLGIHVKRLNTLVWAVAGLLAFTALWLRAGVFGLPVGTALSFGVLLRSIAALVIGRMTNMPCIVLSAIALGVLETAVTFGADSGEEGTVWVALVVLAVLLMRRRSATRADLDSTSSWQQATEVRPVPRQLASLPEVRMVYWLGGAVLLGAVLGLPRWLSSAPLIKATSVVIFAIIGLSVVVLTGWAGQVSLGQMAFVAAGGAVAAYTTEHWQLDPLLAMAAAAAVGAAVAVVVGLPALRFRGFYLAVTTLAFSLVATTYLLSPDYFDWIVTDRFDRQPLLGRIDIRSTEAMFYVAVGALLLTVLLLRVVRRSRTGRVMLAMRENELGAQAYGIPPVRVKLVAFALSGGVAAFAGGLLTYQLQAFSLSIHSPGESVNVFVSTVIGGVGSLAGGLFGALFTKGLGWFLPAEWVVLSTSIGVLFVLLMLPEGLGGAWFRLRDMWLRSVAKGRGITVPGMLNKASVVAAAEPTEGEAA
ncbi:MAG: ABC transporter permease [Acidobacteria bacterium]|nr:ABC transporter permease [Acidobacteriota bacterium]